MSITAGPVRVAVAAAMSILAGLVLTGCPKPKPDVIATTTTSRRVSTTLPRTTTTVNSTTCGTSLDNCYSHDQMQSYADLSIRLVEKFYDATYAHMPHPVGFVYIRRGNTATSACTGRTQDDQSYSYCPTDQKVYLGQEMEWFLYNKFGSIGPVVALAHEYGHHAQNVTRIPAPVTNQQTVQHENQADCMAGAWVAWASSQKLLEYPKDLQNVDGLMTAIASAEGPEQDHGTESQRSRSFSLGYGGAVPACNGYYPSKHIYGA